METGSGREGRMGRFEQRKTGCKGRRRCDQGRAPDPTARTVGDTEHALYSAAGITEKEEAYTCEHVLYTVRAVMAWAGCDLIGRVGCLEMKEDTGGPTH